MKKLSVFFIIILVCFTFFTCTDDDNGIGRVLVKTGVISEESVVNPYYNDYTVIGASGSVDIEGNLPDGYEIEGAGIVYGTDSSELRIASFQRYGSGTYDDFYVCFRYKKYQATGRSSAINVRITDTTYNDHGDLAGLGCADIGGECAFICPLINLPRGTRYYFRTFAHISNGSNYNKYLYGDTKSFVTGGIYQDPSVYVELTALGICISKQDVEIGTGFDAMRYCSYVNCYSTLGGYTDWRVPTLNELEEIYKLRNNIGGFSSGWYFSNQKYGSSDIYYWYWDFSTNQAGYEQLDGYRSQPGRVRLVRNIR